MQKECLGRMASKHVDWESILRERYATFKVEENAFLESLKICNSTEVSAEKIYLTIKDDADIPRNLKLMYREAVYGSDEKVRNRIRNRVGNIRRNLRYEKEYYLYYIQLL